MYIKTSVGLLSTELSDVSAVRHNTSQKKKNLWLTVSLIFVCFIPMCGSCGARVTPYNAIYGEFPPERVPTFSAIVNK